MDENQSEEFSNRDISDDKIHVEELYDDYDEETIDIKSSNLKKGHHRRFSFKKMLLFLMLLCIIGIGIFMGLKLFKETVLVSDEMMFLASKTKNVTLYNMEFGEDASLPRGTEVKVSHASVVDEQTNTTYKKITYKGKEYLVFPDDLVSNKDEVVLEKVMYIRTPAILYENLESVDIVMPIKKGEEVEILGFDHLSSDGSISMYKVRYQDKEGYIYSKYTVSLKDEAMVYYDFNGAYETHQSRDNKYGGGSAANLDYFPVEKPVFEDNVMPSEVRSLYVNSGVLGSIDQYIELALKSGINAFVVDIKDNTAPGYASLVMQELSPTNYNKALNSFEDYKKAIQKLKDHGFYVIGRITTFKDSYYVKDHPENTILDSSGNPYNHDGSYWPSAYKRDVWEFTVKLAIEAVKEMGFNEIQFDYVRFPDRTMKLEKNGIIDFQNEYGEEKAQAIQQFLMYASDEIHKYGAYVSADVFGEAAHNYVTGYGQYWAAISNVVDVISPMPYPDHFSKNEYGFSEAVWTVPYKLLSYWGNNYVQKQQALTATPAIVRSWIQCYDTSKTPAVTYDSSKIKDEIRALRDVGFTGGYMTWHGGSSLRKYKEVSSAFGV